MKMKSLFIALAFMVSLGFVACSSGTAEAEKETPAETTDVQPAADEAVVEEIPNIVGVAVGDENFSTLVAAVQAAGLVETLSGEGPFTVFAPLNAAFDKLPEGTVAGLLEPESKDALTGILTYHVVAGEVKAADVLAAIESNNGSFAIETVQGGTLTATLEDGQVILTDTKGNASTVVATDVAASNGVIHAIDAVVMP